jgi:hypothetical protein
MRRLLIAAALVAVISIAGCSWYSAWMSALGGFYTGGGTNPYDEGQDYDARIESYYPNGRPADAERAF